MNALVIEVVGEGTKRIKAEIALAERVADEDFRRTGATTGFHSERGRLSARLQGPFPQGLDHLVLVVANCGLRGRENYPENHDDQLLFSVRAECT
jgi:hypothetical protein